MPRRDKVCLTLAFVVWVGGAFAADTIMPPALAEEPAAVQVADKPTTEDLPADSPTELWSVETEWPEIEPSYDYIPLDKSQADVLVDSCEECDVPLELALGVMEIESGFDPAAVNPVSGCYGLMQLNPRYFPSGLTPEENIQAGVSYLGELLERYDGDQGAALTAYNAGRDTGSRTYANVVLAAAEQWAGICKEQEDL